MKKTYLRIISFVITMVLMLSFCTMGTAQGAVSYDNLITEGEVFDLVSEYLKQFERLSDGFCDMFEAYTHYNEEASPDYVVVEVDCSVTTCKIYFELDGYYIYCYEPHYYGERLLSYYVVDLESKSVIPYTEALASSKDEYYPFLTDSGYDKIVRIGDINRDNNLDIKDATAIQKCVAELESFDDYLDDLFPFNEKQYMEWYRYVSDFNRDGERNIKDATAIQKCIAGLKC